MALHRRHTLAALTLVFLTACARSPEPEPTLNWQPKLDQPIRQLEDRFDAAQTQQGMNVTSANLGFTLDAKLFVLFQAHTRTMTEAQRNRAIGEQNRWLATRATETRKAAAKFEGGSIAPLVGNMAYIKITRERIAQIQGQASSSSETVP